MWPHADEFLQYRENVQRRGVAIRVFSMREPPRLLPLFAAREERDEIEQRVGRRSQRNIGSQNVAQRLVANPSDVGSAEHRDNLIDEAKLVFGEDSKGIARRVV